MIMIMGDDVMVMECMPDYHQCWRSCISRDPPPLPPPSTPPSPPPALLECITAHTVHTRYSTEDILLVQSAHYQTLHTCTVLECTSPCSHPVQPGHLVQPLQPGHLVQPVQPLHYLSSFNILECSAVSCSTLYVHLRGVLTEREIVTWVFFSCLYT